MSSGAMSSSSIPFAENRYFIIQPALVRQFFSLSVYKYGLFLWAFNAETGQFFIAFRDDGIQPFSLRNSFATLNLYFLSIIYVFCRAQGQSINSTFADR